MKLKKDDIKKARKILKGINYFPVGGDSYIAIPLDMSEDVKKVDGFEIQASNTNVRENNIPVILLWDDDYAPTVLGYVNPAAFVEFNLIQYCELTDCALGKADTKFFKDIDTYLINKNAVYCCFEFEKIKRKEK